MSSAKLVLNTSATRSLVASSIARSAVRAHRIGLSGPRRAVRPSTRNALPSEMTAFVVFHRYLQTETAASTVGTPIPPPGFNAELAKKPLPKEPEPKKSASEQPPKENIKTRESEAKVATTTTAPGKEGEKVLVTAKEEKDHMLEKKKKEEKKMTLWQKVKHEAQHYWDGTKLLGAEIKISTRLCMKMLAGYELTRREHRQLKRTVKDLGRLIPFSVFIIVPAGELFLPIALKFFPNLLPSTYEGEQQKENKSAKLRGQRKEVSDFLKNTLKETGLIGVATKQSEEFKNFFRKVRKSGEHPTNEEVIRVCKIFRDDLTLDNLSRPQLVAMCRYMNLSSFGTDALLRYHIRHRMRQIKLDDKAISFEGIDSLTVPELQMACASRGIRTHGVSVARLRDDLQTWLDLRLKHGVPSTLLVLSNAFMYAQGKETEIESYYDALVSVLSSIPEELYHEMELEVSTAEGKVTNKQRLEVLKEQEELIEEEAEQADGGKSVGHKQDRDMDVDHQEHAAVEAAIAQANAVGISSDANKTTDQQKKL